MSHPAHDNLYGDDDTVQVSDLEVGEDAVLMGNPKDDGTQRHESMFSHSINRNGFDHLDSDTEKATRFYNFSSSLRLITRHASSSFQLVVSERKMWTERLLHSIRLKDMTMWAVLGGPTSLLLSYLLTFLPAYMRKTGIQPTKAASVTSFLDGLRGFGALIVTNFHFLYFVPFRDSKFLNIPLIRVFIGGTAMVQIFFVISGYVLSYNALILIRTKQPVLLLDSLAAAMFRRYIRLYASAVLASFICMILLRLDWNVQATRSPSVVEQIHHWIADTKHFTNPFLAVDGYYHSGALQTEYLSPLWTIPCEFRGSLVVFFFCTATCKLSTRYRMLSCTFLIILCYYLWTMIYPALFLSGILLVDISFTSSPERISRHHPAQTSENPLIQQSLLTRMCFFCLATMSLFLLGQPQADLKLQPWPWPYLDNFIPSNIHEIDLVKNQFWSSIGSMLFVWTLDSCPTLQAPLHWSFSQYLGRISFGVYTMHLPVMWSFWALVLNPWRLKLLGDDPWTYAPFLLLNYAAIFWAGDLFSKADRKIITFGRRTQEKLFAW